MNPVNWFEIPAIDMDRAKAFYQNVFGVELSTLQMGPADMALFEWNMEETGCAGALVKSEGYVPAHSGSIVYFSVPDIEGTLDTIGDNGGRTLLPKMSIGESGFIAHFEDCEGNRVALHSMS